ncbi:MAG: universal stress protein [bacterium]
MANTRIFVVLDPTCMEQAALEWGEQIARELGVHRAIDASLHVYCCINSESVALVPGEGADEAKQATQARVEGWLERLVAQPRADGLDVRTEVEWKEDWRKAIVEAAERQESSLVIKNMTPHSRFVRMVRETSDWTLIRECNCPVLLVKTGRPYQIKKILAAVKHNPDNEAYERANDNVLAVARAWAEDMGAELHAVSCYDLADRPDRQRFADRCGLPRSQVSAASGEPEEIISEVAKDRGSDVVVIARVARAESPNAIGKTARKLIDEIDTEVLILSVNATPIS